MARVETRAPRPAATSDPRPPGVLVVLVAKDGEAWLPQCLLALSRQTHPRIGVLAIDNGSADRSGQLLDSALGADRVVRLDRNAGFAGAVRRALSSELAQQADYLLLLHDDTVLAPDAVSGLVEAAERIDGVGVVGPKVVDWDRPLVLVEVGQSTDRFGYPYSPLEEGEIDQGQYDRIREVLFVSSCAMLVTRSMLERIGGPDERFSLQQEDIDLCWRARLAGYRVLMTPRAVAQHRSATLSGARSVDSPPRPFYERERAALGSMLKNYSVLSLLWLLPLYLLQGIGRILIYAASRRFGDVYQLLAAWAWNALHLPGTVRRRFRVQSVRSVPDRSVRRAMAPAWIRVRRWAGATAPVLLGRASARSELEEVPEPARLGLLRLAAGHPAVTASILAALVAAIAYRSLLSASPLLGGALSAAPPSPTGFFAELVSGLRTTGLGGTAAGSPALGLMGLGSVLTLADPSLFQKLLLLGLPVVAGVGCFRVVKAITAEPVAGVVAGACYGLSTVVLWGLSEGRISALVFLAGLPWLATKLSLAFDARRPVRVSRWIVGAALGTAVLASFYPGTVLAAGVVAVAGLVFPSTADERLRGLALVALAMAAGALLLFPLALEWIRAGGDALADPAGEASFPALARLSLGPAPGAWVTGFFLPAAAVIALAFAPAQFGLVARRFALAAVASLYLAWFSAAGYLPGALSNTVAFVGLAGFSYSLLVGLGLVFLVREARGASFGARQVGSVAMAGVLAVGLAAQIVQAAGGGWAVGGPDRVPAAYPLVGGPDVTAYRVLWLGAPTGEPFPAPGGLPDGEVGAGGASVRYKVGLPSGGSALDMGRPSAGPGYAELERSLAEIMAGDARHGGALLAPFGIRYVVADPDDIPVLAHRRLTRQVDLDVVPAEGLMILRNPKAVRLAATVADARWAAAAAAPDPETARLVPPRGAPLQGGPQRYTGEVPAERSLVMLSRQFDAGWRLHSAGSEPVPAARAFGWAIGFDSSTGPRAVEVRFQGQTVRTAEVAALAALWFLGLWMTRRTSRRA